MKQSKILIVSVWGLLSYALLIAEIITIVVIKNSPLDNVICGHRADVARLIFVLVSSLLLYGSVQSALCIMHRWFSEITITKFLFITGTSFVFPWLQICTILQRPLSASKVAAFIRKNKYYAVAFQEPDPAIVIATNSGNVTALLESDEIYLFERDYHSKVCSESVWKMETGQEGSQALVCRLPICPGTRERLAARKIIEVLQIKEIL